MDIWLNNLMNRHIFCSFKCMQRTIPTNNQMHAKSRTKVVSRKYSITREESEKADQNLDLSVRVEGVHLDNCSQYLRSNFYPDGPGGNYNGL